MRNAYGELFVVFSFERLWIKKEIKAQLLYLCKRGDFHLNCTVNFKSAFSS